MPPKGKVAAKAATKTGSTGGKSDTEPVPVVTKPTGKQKEGKASNDSEPIPVPPPPPTPVLIKFPDTSPGGSEGAPREDAAARCVLLSWRDKDGLYKLQARSFTFLDRDPEQGWEDLPSTSVQPRPFAGRKDVYIASGLQNIRSEFRLVNNLAEKPHLGNRYVANWFSSPSEPSLSVVDPSLRPFAKVVPRGDYSSPGVVLQFRSTNPDFAKEAENVVDGSDLNDLGPWAGWPGLGICRVQARWRLLRRYKFDAQGCSASPSSPTGKQLKREILEGEKQVGQVVDVGVECPFDVVSGTWSFTAVDLPTGFVIRLEARLGTAYRWSQWSEESDDVPIFIEPPRPQALAPFIETLHVTDSMARVRWTAFQLATTMHLCEYRVMACQLAGTTSETMQKEDWDDASAFVAGIFTVDMSTRSDDLLEFEVKCLAVDMYYSIRVDARHPYVGERDWSTPATMKEPFRTDFASQMAPAGPLAMTLQDVEVLLEQSGSAKPFKEDQAWLALLIERWTIQDYRIEFAPCAQSDGSERYSRVQSSPSVVTSHRTPEEIEEEIEEAANAGPGGRGWLLVSEVRRLGVPDNLDSHWVAVAVLLPDLWSGRNCKVWDSVVCRLRHRIPASVSPYLGTGSTSVPMVPKVSPPAVCTASTRFSRSEGVLGVMVRFYLGTAPPGEDADVNGRHEALSVMNLVRKKTQRFNADTRSTSKGIARVGIAMTRSGTRRHLTGHRLVTLVQARCRCLDDQDELSGWLHLPPVHLPPAQPGHSRLAAVGPPPVPESKLRIPGADLVWDVGERHELWLWSSDGLILGSEYEVQIRVGTAECFSPWTAAAEQLQFSAPIARPLPPKQVPKGSEPRLQLLASSECSVIARFPPFQLPSNASTVEYVLTAKPRFRSAAKANAEDHNQGTAEADVPMGTKVVTFLQKHPRTRTDDEVMESLAQRNQLKDFPENSQLSHLKALLQQEWNEDLEDLEKEPLVEVQIDGLLPATCYQIIVEAQFPGLPGRSSGFEEVIETLCGPPAPSAPQAVPVSKAGDSEPGPVQKVFLLEVEDRANYILQCQALPAAGWFGIRGDGSEKHKRKDADPSQTQAAIRWWPSASQEDLGWRNVETKLVPPGLGQKAGYCRLLAIPPPNLGTAYGELKEPPDMFRFRLVSADRASSHPCSWVGADSEPLSVCIAPPPLAPILRRCYSDKSWCIRAFFFAHSTTRPQGSVTLSQLRSTGLPQEALTACNDLAGDSSEDCMSDQEAFLMPEMQDQNEVLYLPAGFGHRSVCFVQARAWCGGYVNIQRSDGDAAGDHPPLNDKERDWIELPEISLSQCKVKSPAALQGVVATKVGDLHEAKISCGLLEEGAVYVIQIRLGNGNRWSAWSPISSRIPFAVTQPQPPSDGLQVQTLSASVVRFSWPAFKVVDGVSEVSYRLLAEPTSLGTSLQGNHVTELQYDFDALPYGNAIQAELTNLLPDTEYVFSVAARYPSIGWRCWGRRLATSPAKLQEDVCDWVAPPMPTVFPRNGPRPFATSEEELPIFHPSELAFLLAFADTEKSQDGIHYRLEYRFVGLDVDGPWTKPMEVFPVALKNATQAQVLSASVAPWKLSPTLWGVRLPSLLASLLDATAAQMQQVQFRLACEAPEDCPSTRWFSSLTPPLCPAIAAPLETSSKLKVNDTHLAVQVSFVLDRHLCNVSANIGCAGDEVASEEGGTALAALPRGFGHAFAVRFQVRYRHSIRPPGIQALGSSRKPPGMPWSAWAEGPDAGLQAAECISDQGSSVSTYAAMLTQSDGAQLEYGSYYQVSVRVSDGTCWSDWSEPSSPLKIFVAPPKPDRADSDVLTVIKETIGSNVRLRWPTLRAHCGLKLIEYALRIHEVLHDGTQICPRQVAAVWVGRAAGAEAPIDGPEMTSYELRDLRVDVNYVFKLTARYPHIGPRDFEDALSSALISLRPTAAPLAVPMQISIPLERLRRLQVSRCVFLRWSMGGIAVDGEDVEHIDVEVEGNDRRFDLQALPEGLREHEWILCRSITRLKVDGYVAWLVKDIPGRAARVRFRLWDREMGRFGRASPLMLACVDPVPKLGACRVVSEFSSHILLRAPLESASGSDEFVCRYQIRYRAEQVGAPWVELQPQMMWHRQNDHLTSPDDPTDALGAVISGLGQIRAVENDVAEEMKVATNSAAPAENEQELTTKPHAASPGQRPPALPTLPLAVVNVNGEVVRQRCIVSVLREEDGLLEDTLYTFCIRVGDLYRFSDWSPPSTAVKLGVPPPQLSSGLSTSDAQIQVTEVTDCSLYASWPMLLPAVQIGVPIQVEVEYLLVVLPMTAKRRVVGRGVPKVQPPTAHSQWLLSSKLPAGSSPDTVGCNNQLLGITVTGLEATSSYELRLSVRYGRLGTRKWSDVFSYVLTTKKSEGINNGKSSPPPLPNSGLLTGNLEAGGKIMKLDSKYFLKVKEGPVYTQQESPRLGSPPLDARAESPRGSGPVPESPRRLPPLDPLQTATHVQVEEVSPEDAEEWLAGSQANTNRLLSGAGSRTFAGQTMATSAAQEEMLAAYPLVRPFDYVPFWKRDQSAVSQAVNNPGLLAPRPPTMERPLGSLGRRLPDEGQAYPRRSA